MLEATSLAKHAERGRKRRRKRARSNKLLWLIILLWLLSLFSAGMVFVNLSRELDRVEVVNAQLARQVASLQAQVDAAATGEALQEVLRRVDEQERSIEQVLRQQEALRGEIAAQRVNSIDMAGGPAAATGAAAPEGAVAPEGVAVPGGAVAASSTGVRPGGAAEENRSEPGGVTFAGSLLNAISDALRLRLRAPW